MTTYWGDGASWTLDSAPSPHEAHYLKLDASRARADLNWAPALRLDNALEYLVTWYKAAAKGADVHKLTLDQIESYSKLVAHF